MITFSNKLAKADKSINIHILNSISCLNAENWCDGHCYIGVLLFICYEVERALVC